MVSLTARPARASSIAAVSPAAPAPITTASGLSALQAFVYLGRLAAIECDLGRWRYRLAWGTAHMATPSTMYFPRATAFSFA
jgi:hypothetical protein